MISDVTDLQFEVHEPKLAIVSSQKLVGVSGSRGKIDIDHVDGRGSRQPHQTETIGGMRFQKMFQRDVGCLRLALIG